MLACTFRHHANHSTLASVPDQFSYVSCFFVVTPCRTSLSPRGDRVRSPCHGRLPRGGGSTSSPAARARPWRRRAALGGVLLGELPERAQRGAAGDVAGRHEQLPQRRRHPPPLLPRLLRQRLRRVAAARRHARHAGREDRRPQRRRLHLRLRPHRHHQGAGRGLLPGRRLLRRRPLPRRARQRQPPRRAELGRAARPARRAAPEPHRRGHRAPGPGLRPRGPRGGLRRQGPHLARPRRALGRAHRRHGALRQLPHARLLRRQRQPGLRGAAAAGVPGDRRRRRGRAARRDHTGRVRQRVLPEPRGGGGAHALRPGALQQRAPGLARAHLQRQRRRLRVGFQDLHDQSRQRQPAHRDQRRDQARLQESQFLIGGK